MFQRGGQQDAAGFSAKGRGADEAEQHFGADSEQVDEVCLELALTRWRAGKSEDVTVKFAVLGSYSATAPYDCPKSKRILEQGCKALAERVADVSPRQNPIPRALNALALLASGNPNYLPLIKKESQWAAAYSAGAMQTWYYGYVIMFLAEYQAKTNDPNTLIVPSLLLVIQPLRISVHSPKNSMLSCQ